MTTVKDAIIKIRFLAHDEQETGYDDIVVLQAINDGIDFVGRIIKNIRPNLLSIEEQGQINAYEKTIKLKNKIAGILDVRINGKRLSPTNRMCISDFSITSEHVKQYYIVGFSEINIYPIPNKDVNYNIQYIPEFEELSENDIYNNSELPFPNDFHKLIIEYANTRLAIANEFDTTQEMAIIQAITSQVEDMLYAYPDTQHKMKSYWDNDVDEDCIKGYL